MFKSQRFPFKFKSTVLFVREDPPAGPTITPDIQKIIDATVATAVAKAVETETTGLKSKNSELLGNLKTVKDALKAFEGLDPVRAKALVDQIDNDDDTKLIAAGKKNEVIEKYTARMRAEHATQLEALGGQVKAQVEIANTYRGAVLDNQIRAVCGDLHKGAVDDALLHARSIFSLDAKGNAVKMNPEGVPELGKDGKTPYNPVEWMEQQRELKPHWFPAQSSGSGAGGANGTGSGAKTIKRSAYDQLTPVQQGNTVRSGVAIVD